MKKKTSDENKLVNYTTVWNNNKFTAYADSKRTITSDDLGPARSVSSTRFSRASGALLTKGIRNVISSLRKFKKAEQSHQAAQQHDPKVCNPIVG